MQTRSERRVVAELRRQLQPADHLLENVRITDPAAGDVEIDVLLLLPGHGLAAVEVKGGRVSFDDGQWLLRNPRGSRRIAPIEQARNGKHGIRRFLARALRQPSSELIRVQWFLALPGTEVTADFGPEGRREQLIGEADLGSALSIIKRELAITNPGYVPTHSDITAVLAALRGTRVDEASRAPLHNWRWALAVAAAVALIGSIWLLSQASESVAAKCSPNYEPCVPVLKDLDCAELGQPVRVVGVDEYRLDRDGDGMGCEWNG